MGKIIIANIGNRSLIKKNGQGKLEELLKFRSETEEYLQKPENIILKELEINILNALIDDLDEKEDIEKIYLFTSNQEGQDYSLKVKDTIHAGKLLKIIIENRYDIETIPVCLNGVPVVDLDELIPNYRKELENIYTSNDRDDVSFVICDSGGTPQQKNALKLVTEYFLEKEKVSFYQIREEYDRNGDLLLGQSKIHKQNFYQIRKISDAINIGLLIDEAEYAAAAKIRSKTNNNDSLHICLKALAFRFELMHEEGIGLLKDNHIISFLSLYVKKEATGNNFEKWEQDLSRENYFKLCEILEVANFYWHKKDWTNIVLKYQIFFEFFLNRIIQKLEDNPSWRNIPQKIKFIEDNEDQLTEFTKEMILAIKKVYSTYINEQGINKLRNQIAHDGKGITLEEIDASVSGQNFETIIQEWHMLLGVPFIKSENIFIQSNDNLKSSMQLE